MRWRSLALAAALVAAIGLSGCGGSGSGSSTSAPGRLSGSVFLTAGSVAAGSGAAAITVSVEGTALRTTAGVDGSFSLDGVPAGYQTVVAQTPQRSISVVAQVEPGKQTDLGQMALADAGSITGTVTAATGGAPIEGAHVTVVEAVTANGAGVGPRPVRHAVTDAAGLYSVAALDPGPYAVLIGKRGFLPAVQLVDVVAGAATTANAALAAAASAGTGVVEGTVSTTNASGEVVPLAGALVRLGRTDETDDLPIPDVMTNGKGDQVDLRGDGHRGGVPLFAFTDKTGAYRIEGVPAGTFRAMAVRAGFDPKAVEVSLTAGQVVRQDFTLVPHVRQVGEVAGVVTDKATGLPIGGAAVVIRMQAPPAPGEDGHGVATQGGGSGGCIPPDGLVLATTADAVGAYSLKVPAGDRLVIVIANGYQVGVQPVTVVAGQKATANVALTALTGTLVKLSGTVVTAAADGTKSPVPGAVVMAAGAPDASGRPVAGFRTVTDASGHFALSVPAGPYVISAHKDRMMAPPRRLDIQSDTTIELELSVVGNR